MSDEVAAQDALYDQRMKYISEQNKIVEKKRTDVQEKERALNLQELELTKTRNEFSSKNEKLLIKQADVATEKEALARERVAITKERTILDRDLQDNQELIDLKTTYKTELAHIDSQKAEYRTKFMELEKQANAQVKREVELAQRGEYLQHLADSIEAKRRNVLE